jgi:hypothetical protein
MPFKCQVLALGPQDMRMYYHTFNSTAKQWVVGVATSKDGFNWRKQGPVFSGSETADFDVNGAAAHHVVKDGDSKRWLGSVPLAACW